MNWLIWIGAAISLAGVAGLVACVVVATGVRRAKLPDAEGRARLKRVVVLNMGALMVSALGLICVVLGIVFGG